MQRALVAAEKVGGRIESGYWLADGGTPGQIPSEGFAPTAAAYGNGIYLVVGHGVRSSDGDSIITTIARVCSDGKTWRSVGLPLGDEWTTALFANGYFLVGSRKANNVFVSTNCTNWTRVDMSLNLNGTNMFSAGDKFIFHNRSDDTVKISSNGTSWETHSLSGISDPNKFSFNPDDGKVYCITWDNIIYSSENGYDFTQVLDLSNKGIDTLWSFAVGGECAAMCINTSGRHYMYRAHLDTGNFEIASETNDYTSKTLKYANGVFFAPDGMGVMTGGATSGYFSTNTLPYERQYSGYDSAMVSYLNGVFLGWCSKKTSYSIVPIFWRDAVTSNIEDFQGNDKTGEIMSAIMRSIDLSSIVQTNTLDAAYTQGVNAYQGE